MERNNGGGIPLVMPGQLNLEITRVNGPSYVPFTANVQGPAGLKLLQAGGATRLEVLAATLMRGRAWTVAELEGALDAAQMLIDGAERRLALASKPA